MSPDDPRALVAIFLRGAADGLALVPPVGDDDYHRARPRIAIAEREGLRLDGFFALAPQLAELRPLCEEGQLSIVHACGSDDDTRSHFEAQDLMEHGGTSVAGGWIGRWLRSAGESGPLAALWLGCAATSLLLASAFLGLARAMRLAERHPSDTVKRALLWASYNATECAPHCAALLLTLAGSGKPHRGLRSLRRRHHAGAGDPR